MSRESWRESQLGQLGAGFPEKQLGVEDAQVAFYRAISAECKSFKYCLPLKRKKNISPQYGTKLCSSDVYNAFVIVAMGFFAVFCGTAETIHQARGHSACHVVTCLWDGKKRVTTEAKRAEIRLVQERKLLAALRAPASCGSA